AGYAYLAAAHGQSYDGVVAQSNYINSGNANAILLIHEIGHYLNLRHPFQGGCPNNDCLLQGDRVCDTPPDNSTAAVSPCSGSFNSCTTDADDPRPINPFTTDVPDNHRLYMDYGFWSCMNQFTQGQKDRMMLALLTTRASLLQSQGCIPPTGAEI